jgi:hypothetical protein
VSDEQELKEIDEALEAIRKAFYALNESVDKVGTAKSWSTYDTWFGGGMFASLFKRERVDRAEQSMRGVDFELAEVRKQLADVDIHDLGGLGIGGTERTLDVWFDNIVTDLMTHSKLKSAQQRLDLISRALVQVQSELRRRRSRLVGDLETET